MSRGADQISAATRFLADGIVDGVDASEWARLIMDDPIVAALAADMLLHHARSGMTVRERGVWAQALRFSTIAKLTENPL